MSTQKIFSPSYLSLSLAFILTMMTLVTFITTSNALAAERVFNVEKSVVSKISAKEILSILKDYKNTCDTCKYHITGLKEMLYLRPLTPSELEPWKKEIANGIAANGMTIIDAHYMWQSVKQVKYFNSLYVVIAYKKDSDNTYYLESHLVDSDLRDPILEEFSLDHNSIFYTMDSKWTITETSPTSTSVKYENEASLSSSLAFLFGSLIYNGLNKTADEILALIL
ncbi:MAG: hypothetical protein HQK49_18355 [Oligoflexia bacterium]|nr:hypothetical protein [Oligoflexia bacterium]